MSTHNFEAECSVLGGCLLDPDAAAATGLRFAEESKRLHLRVRRKDDGTLFALVINSDLDRPAGARFRVAPGTSYRVTDVLAARTRGDIDAERAMAFSVPAGGAKCFKLEPLTP